MLRNMKNLMWVSICAVLLLVGCNNQGKQNDKQAENTTGKPLRESTIDSALQTAADSFLCAEMAEIGAIQGQAIVIEVKTGEIRALVGNERRFDGSYTPCSNFTYQQEPGSTMSVTTLLAMFETGKVNLTDEVDTKSGVWLVDGEFMKDHNWHRGGYGVINLEKAILVSSYIAISKTARKVYKGKEQEFFDQLDKMSYGQPDSIEGIPGLKPSAYSSPKDSDWVSHELIWSAIGFDRQIAPIQTLTFYNSIANNGQMVRPTLKPGKVDVINEQIASKRNIEQMQQVLRKVVEDGLGKRAGSGKTSVAGMPATVVVSNLSNGDIAPTQEFHVLFCGYFPADKPKYSIIVSMNKFGLPASGGAMAGPVVHNIVDWMIGNGY